MLKASFAEVARIAITHGAVQRPGELAEFLEFLDDFKPEVIVEIGVFAGGTLYAWQQVAPTVIGIDVLPGGPWPIYPSSNKSRDEHDATVIVGDTHDLSTLAELIRCLHRRPIDVLFIDGDHSYDGVRNDWAMYAPYVRTGGLIVFHDIVSHYDNCDVPQFWEDIKDETAVEIIDPTEPVWGGFGVLRASLGS